MTHNLSVATASAVREAGTMMLKRYSTLAHQPGLAELLADVRDNDAAVVDTLRPRLSDIRPGAG